MEEHRANLFLLVDEVKLLRRLIGICEACRYAKDLAVEGQEDASFRRTVASKYQHGLAAAIFAERAVDTAHWRNVALTRFGALFQAPGNTAKSLDYSDTLPQQPLGEFPKVKRSKFNEEYKVRAGQGQTLSDPIMNVEDRQRDRGTIIPEEFNML